MGHGVEVGQSNLWVTGWKWDRVTCGSRGGIRTE